MGRGSGKSSREYALVQVGEPGPPFRPELDYFSVSLQAIYTPPRGFFQSSKFAPVIWSSVKHLALDGEKTLVGLFPPPTPDREKFLRADRVTVEDLQLTPRVVVREQLDIDFTFGQVKEKDFLADALKVVTDIANSPAAAFISQTVTGAVTSAAKTVDLLNSSMSDMMDEGALQSLGRAVKTLRSPATSGVFAFIDKSEGAAGLKFNEATGELSNAKGPIKSAHAVIRLRREETRPDWMALPDLVQAWNTIRSEVLAGGNVKDAIERFRLTALTSPDLTRADADRLTEAVRQKFAGVMADEETASIDDFSDMEKSIGYFLENLQRDAGLVREADAEAATFGSVPVYMAPGPFKRSLDMVLKHEGGFVDHPNDRGGPTNKGITTKIFNDFQLRKKEQELKRKFKDKAEENEARKSLRSVKTITDQELHEIYYEGYWLPAKCTQMPTEAISALMLDAAVNHGPAQAIRMLQQASGLADAKCDGLWGAETKTRVFAAAANAVRLTDACLVRRERYYRRIVELDGKQAAFLNGWMNRLTGLRGYLEPLLARAPGGGDTESAIFVDSGEAVLLRAADPDFSSLDPPK